MTAADRIAIYIVQPVAIALGAAAAVVITTGFVICEAVADGIAFARARIRIKLWTLTSRMMSRCRKCGGRKEVVCFDPRGLWAYPTRKTYCPQHCPDHDFAYQRDHREWGCNVCGEPAPHDFWAYHP